MILKNLHLQHFRNQKSANWNFEDPITVLVGDNARGKTSILEAIYLLSTGESFRADKVAEMITFEQELGRVMGVIENDEKIELEVLLTRGVVQGKKTQSRLFSVNQIRRRRKDFAGKLLTIIFRPEDMRLIEGSPSRRRHLLNETLQLTSPSYLTALSSYEAVLLRRNKLLLQIREGSVPRSVLHYWTEQLVKHGEAIQLARTQLCSAFAHLDFPIDLRIEYQPSLISHERIAQYAEQEIAAGHVLVGPHKDDFIVYLEDHDVSVYGSRGQQRLAVLWLKLQQLHYLETKLDQPATLLLDDIFSELDPANRELVFSLMHDRQVFISSADPEVIEELKEMKRPMSVIQL
jgi:DNA replication and repair protein RecF